MPPLISMAINLPNTIQIPLAVFDELLPKMTTASELKIVLLAFRHSMSYDAKELTQELFESCTGLSASAVRVGLEAAVEHKILNKLRNKTGTSYVLNLSTDIDIEISKRDRKPRTDLHGRLIDAIYVITDKKCNIPRETAAASQLIKMINSGMTTEMEVFGCLEWAEKHQFDFYAPSLVSVKKLLPQYARLKKSGTLETFRESKKDREASALDERNFSKLAYEIIEEETARSS